MVGIDSLQVLLGGGSSGGISRTTLSDKAVGTRPITVIHPSHLGANLPFCHVQGAVLQGQAAQYIVGQGVGGIQLHRQGKLFDHLVVAGDGLAIFDKGDLEIQLPYVVVGGRGNGNIGQIDGVDADQDGCDRRCSRSKTPHWRS